MHSIVKSDQLEIPSFLRFRSIARSSARAHLPPPRARTRHGGSRRYPNERVGRSRLTWGRLKSTCRPPPRVLNSQARLSAGVRAPLAGLCGGGDGLGRRGGAPSRAQGVGVWGGRPMGRFMAPWPPLLSHGHVRVFLAAAAWVPRNCVWRAFNAMCHSIDESCSPTCIVPKVKS